MSAYLQIRTFTPPPIAHKYPDLARPQDWRFCGISPWLWLAAPSEAGCLGRHSQTSVMLGRWQSAWRVDHPPIGRGRGLYFQCDLAAVEETDPQPQRSTLFADEDATRCRPQLGSAFLVRRGRAAFGLVRRLQTSYERDLSPVGGGQGPWCESDGGWSLQADGGNHDRGHDGNFRCDTHWYRRFCCCNSGVHHCGGCGLVYPGFPLMHAASWRCPFIS
jgi:hypothetical protein